MLENIKGKLNGYFTASTGNNQSPSSVDRRKKEKIVRDFSEFNYNSRTRKGSRGEEFSQEAIDSLIRPPGTRDCDIANRTTGFESNYYMNRKCTGEKVFSRPTTNSMICVNEEELINDRIQSINSKIMMYHKENLELDQEINQHQAVERLSQ